MSAAAAIQVGCDYFALCDRAADGVVDVTRLGPVPTCQRCADKVGAPIVLGDFVVDADGQGATFTEH